MTRLILIVLAILSGIVGLGLLIAGVVLLALFGTSGRAFTDTGQFSSPLAALVSEPEVVFEEGTPSAAGDLATVLVEGESRNDKAIFIGIGRTGDVDRYLAEVARDLILDVDYGPFRLDTAPQEGSEQAEPPTSQTFWVAQTSGEGRQELSWDIQSGSFRLVVMNADGSSGIDVEGRAGLSLSFIFPLSLTFTILGGVLVVLAVVLLVLGIRSRRQRQPVPTGYAPPAPGTGAAAPGQAPSPGQAPPSGQPPPASGPPPSSTT